MTKKKPAETKATETKATETLDVEGQGYLLDPLMASRLTQDRTKAVERSMAERSIKKEARPNKPHQG
ncbi:MAG TPA: hypothetical protein VFW02_01240 [Candidatus Limnocylindrales bacterium]|nr:hypothetical protein [Candidatus Limnocylindrales bacterium]